MGWKGQEALQEGWEPHSGSWDAPNGWGAPLLAEPRSLSPHPSLLAGKYLENHGVVHNMWFNTSTGVKLPYYTTQGIDSWWDNGSLPIWITAQRQASGAAALRLCAPGDGRATIPSGQQLTSLLQATGLITAAKRKLNPQAAAGRTASVLLKIEKN